MCGFLDVWVSYSKVKLEETAQQCSDLASEGAHASGNHVYIFSCAILTENLTRLPVSRPARRVCVMEREKEGERFRGRQQDSENKQDRARRKRYTRTLCLRVCLCIYVFVCVRESERERESKCENERENERDKDREKKEEPKRDKDKEKRERESKRERRRKRQSTGVRVRAKVFLYTKSSILSKRGRMRSITSLSTALLCAKKAGKSSPYPWGRRLRERRS